MRAIGVNLPQIVGVVVALSGHECNVLAVGGPFRRPAKLIPFVSFLSQLPRFPALGVYDVNVLALRAIGDIRDLGAVWGPANPVLPAVVVSCASRRSSGNRNGPDVRLATTT